MALSNIGKLFDNHIRTVSEVRTACQARQWSGNDHQGKFTCSSDTVDTLNPNTTTPLFLTSPVKYLMAFAIEFVTFTIDLVPFAVQFVTFVIEFSLFAIELVSFAVEFVAFAIELFR